MKNIKIDSSHKAGRRTQIMADNFSDLAGVVNNKLIDKSVPPVSKESLNELLGCLELALKKSEDIRLTPKLQKIMKKIEKVSDQLHEYILDKN
jgi:hypothetical protein